MSGFVKIYGTILQSSVWMESPPTRILWVTMLTMADRHGRVESSLPGLAHIANISRQECEAGLAKLMAPDPDSKSKRLQGRRIRACRGGWEIINYQTYREYRTDAQSKRAERAKNFRERKTKAGEGYVYYALDGDEIKVGWSTNPWVRVAEMRTARPGMVLLAKEPGTKELEKQRHVELAAFRIQNGRGRGGEWFRWCPAVESVVARSDRSNAQIAEAEVEAETTTTPPYPPAGGVSVREVPQKRSGLPPYDQVFNEAWATLQPLRPGQSKVDAWRQWLARVGDGADPLDMLAGAHRFAKHHERERTEPRYVMHAARFFGKGRHFEADFSAGPDPFAHLNGYPRLVDDFGCMTEYGERVTRPARVA